jgi:hypothetical protein
MKDLILKVLREHSYKNGDDEPFEHLVIDESEFENIADAIVKELILFSARIEMQEHQFEWAGEKIETLLSKMKDYEKDKNYESEESFLRRMKLTEAWLDEARFEGRVEDEARKMQSVTRKFNETLEKVRRDLDGDNLTAPTPPATPADDESLPKP